MSEKRSKKALRAILAAVDGALSGRPLAAALSEALGQEQGLGPGERRAAANGARALVRELRRVDLVLARACADASVELRKLPAYDKTLLRYLALRVAVEGEEADRPLRELALPGPRRPRSIGDDVLARVAARLSPVEKLALPDDPVVALAIRRSVPDFLARRLAAELGVERADAVLAAANQPARLDLRTNGLLTTRAALKARLERDGVAVSPLALAPGGLLAADRTGLFGKAHQEGLFELQDEGSQLIALLCAAPVGGTVLDCCAGSGGKALALAEQVGRSGCVLAFDPVVHRLAELPARARRARAQGIVQAAGGTPGEEWRGKADVVLVDAPCSGVGSLRREPDLRWRLKEAELDAYPARQLEILGGAAQFVRPGGALVYATCSPFRAEDEGVVERFLAGHTAFRLEAPVDFPASAVEAGALRVWPDRHGGGGFFGARLVRR